MAKSHFTYYTNSLMPLNICHLRQYGSYKSLIKILVIRKRENMINPNKPSLSEIRTGSRRPPAVRSAVSFTEAQSIQVILEKRLGYWRIWCFCCIYRNGYSLRKVWVRSLGVSTSFSEYWIVLNNWEYWNLQTEIPLLCNSYV